MGLFCSYWLVSIYPMKIKLSYFAVPFLNEPEGIVGRLKVLSFSLNPHCLLPILKLHLILIFPFLSPFISSLWSNDCNVRMPVSLNLLVSYLIKRRRQFCWRSSALFCLGRWCYSCSTAMQYTQKKKPCRKTDTYTITHMWRPCRISRSSQIQNQPHPQSHTKSKGDISLFYKLWNYSSSFDVM